MARPLSAQATVLLLPGLVMWPDLHLLLLTETAKREEPSRPELVLLVWANLETLLAMLRVLQEKRLALLLAVQLTRRDLFLHSVMLEERQRQLEPGSPVRQARARRCSRCPGPYAFCQETPAARKCNRAARCDDFPISARCRPQRNRRALAGCDNKCSRLRRKRARRARTFPIGAADKCRCLPRPIAD